MFCIVAPRPIDGTVEQFGFIVGEEGVISVQIHANPKPRLTWTIDQDSFPEGSMDLTQRFEATSARDMVCGPPVFIMIFIFLIFYFLRIISSI
jgi:hypothetical protein